MDGEAALAVGLIEADLDRVEARIERLLTISSPLAEDATTIDDEFVVDLKVPTVVRVERKTVFAALGNSPPAAPADAEYHVGHQDLANLGGCLEAGLSDRRMERLALPRRPESEVLTSQAKAVGDE